ncbi:hypothetical protein [Rhizobium sp. NXC24]|uniref:hypothetical protein n=1 Tax=Rhizobium sp. NXC24 TaxID=2048897 RepID=UPI000CF28E7B|nr:hypothetical protein [Rhizobium sp. NXC24]
MNRPPRSGPVFHFTLRVAQFGGVDYIGSMAQEHDISSKVEQTVERLLRDRLETSGFEGADIRSDRDLEGDPILVVDVKYRFVDRPISSKVTFGLTTELRKALMALGESRFPQVRHHFNEQQKIAS